MDVRALANDSVRAGPRRCGWRLEAARGYRRRHTQSCPGGGRTGVLSACAVFLINDMRDPQGLTRPLLRSVAGKLSAGHHPLLRKAGGCYLCLDPLARLTATVQGQFLLSSTDSGAMQAPTFPASFPAGREKSGGRD
jgi:hypothetical protein